MSTTIENGTQDDNKVQEDRSLSKGSGEGDSNDINNDKGSGGEAKGDRKKSRLSFEVSRPLEPLNKKISSIESQRLMNVFSSAIERVKLVSMIPYITKHLEEFENIFESDLMALFKHHFLLETYYGEIETELSKRETERESLRASRNKRASPNDDDQQSEQRQPENASVSNPGLKPDHKQLGETFDHKTQLGQLVARQTATGERFQAGRVDERQRNTASKNSQANKDREQEPETGKEKEEKKDEDEEGEGEEEEEEEEEIDEENYNNSMEWIAKNLDNVAEWLDNSCKNILRAFSKYPSAVTAVNDRLGNISKAAAKFIQYMEEMKVILRCRLLISPIEEKDQADYLKDMIQKTVLNEILIKKLETELAEAISIKEEETRKRNEIYRHFQKEIQKLDKNCDEGVRRVKIDAEKDIALELKSSDAKCAKVQQKMAVSKNLIQNLITEHRNQEIELRKRNSKAETEVENWIQKYDQDMGQLQDEFETIDAIYNKEKKQLEDLEIRFEALQKEYVTIIEEREIARKLREESARKVILMARAAITIQSYWRSYKVRKMLRIKKKKLAAKNASKKKKKKK